MYSYPINFLPATASITIVLVLTLAAYWVATKDQSPRPLGLIAFPVVGISGWTWFTHLPEWTAWVTFILVTALFVIGMFRDEAHDNKWHYGALAVALFGKMVMGFAPVLTDVLNGEVTVNGWTIAFILGFLVAVILIVTTQLGRRLLNRADPAPSHAPTT